MQQALALGDVKGLDKNPQFVRSVEKLVSAFFAAGLRHQVTEIERKFDYLLFNNRRLVLTLLQHYGLLALGAPVLDREEVTKLQVYIEACDRFKMYYPALEYRIAIAAKLETDWKERVKMLLDDVDSLPLTQRQAFYDSWKTSTVATNIAKTPEARHERVASVYRMVLEAFPDRFVKTDAPSSSVPSA